MNRRTFLATVAGATAVGVAGCGSIETRAVDIPTVVQDRPDGIYLPSHVEGMAHVGTAMASDYSVALTYSYPHRFWTVTLDSVERTPIEDTDSIHLMATVWDPDTGQVFPEAGVSVAITREGSLVSQETLYAMLSQTMGVHHGANFGGLADGRTYDIQVTAGAPTGRSTGAFRGRFTDPATARFTFPFATRDLRSLRIERIENAGDRDALEPLDDTIPSGGPPPAGDFPGARTARSGDVHYVVVILSKPPGGIEGDQYLAVSPRSRYNGLPLARMGVSFTLERGGSTVAERRLNRTMDSELGYHYGARVPPVERGDELSILVDTPPQIARHEGYETAFFDVPPTTVTL